MKTVRVWIVDDNDPDVFLMQLALRKTSWPLEVTVLKDGAAAMNHIDGCSNGAVPSPELVFLDFFLPQIGGAEVLQTVRRTPAMENTQVVVFSSMPDPPAGDMDWTRYRYMQKPTNLRSFMGGVVRIVHEVCEPPPGA